MHHAGIWRYTAELDLVLAQDPRPDGRYGLAAFGSEVVVCLHSSPRVSGALSSFLRCFPELAQGGACAEAGRSVNDLGLFGSLRPRTELGAPHPALPGGFS